MIHFSAFLGLIFSTLTSGVFASGSEADIEGMPIPSFETQCNAYFYSKANLESDYANYLNGFRERTALEATSLKGSIEFFEKQNNTTLFLILRDFLPTLAGEIKNKVQLFQDSKTDKFRKLKNAINSSRNCSLEDKQTTNIVSDQVLSKNCASSPEVDYLLNSFLLADFNQVKPLLKNTAEVLNSQLSSLGRVKWTFNNFTNSVSLILPKMESGQIFSIHITAVKILENNEVILDGKLRLKSTGNKIIFEATTHYETAHPEVLSYVPKISRAMEFQDYLVNRQVIPQGFSINACEDLKRYRNYLKAKEKKN